MAQGGVSNQVTSGGGPSGGGAALAARTVILLGVSPAGLVNTLYNPGSASAIKSALDVAVLGEACAKLLEHGGTSVYACPLNPSTAGALSAAVTQVGNGAGTVTPALAPHKAITVKCILGGTLGTATFQFSLDGGVTYGATVTSAVATWLYLVPGTFCTLSFAAATYVATKTNTIGTDGTVTPGSGWVGTVTQVSSPLDNYDLKITVTKAGALGLATIQVSLDGGNSTLPTMLVPAGGVVVIPGTGIYLTLASTFVLGDTYSFLAVAPGFSTSDLTAAVNAVAALSNAPPVALCYIVATPATAAGAISAASSLETALVNAAANNGKQWIGMCDAPSSEAGDTVLSGGAAIVDVADTAAVLRTARVGSTFNHTSVCVGTNRMTSSINGAKLKRPTGLAIAARYVEDDPRNDIAAVARGQLDIFAIGRDEQAAASTLYDAQYVTLTTMPTFGGGAFVTIESGGYGWRNMTTDPNFQDANGVRVLALFLSAITAAGLKYLGSRQSTNTDGTIVEGARQAISGDVDGAAKRSVGLLTSGAFAQAQASLANASVLASSQLGNSPHRLDIQYALQSLGFVSQVNDAVQFGGTIKLAA